MVPRPKKRKKPKPAPVDDDDDFLGALSDAVDDEFDAMPVAPLPKPTRRGGYSSGKKKKKSKNSEGTLKKLAPIISALFIGLVLISIVGKFISRYGKYKKYVANQEVTWIEFSPPGGQFTVLMPGRPVPRMQPTGFVTEHHHMAKTKKFACDATYADVPEMVVLNDTIIDQMLGGIREVFKQKVAEVTLLSDHPITLGTVRGIEFEFERAQSHHWMRAYVTKKHVVTVEFFMEKGGSQTEARDKFFNSLTLGGTPAATGSPGSSGTSPGTTASTTTPAASNEKPYLERRANFKTSLTSAGPAPQQFEAEQPPAGVEEVVYQSGDLQLKAWVDKRGVKGDKAPALVFFHGGFAFGGGDLEECKPFRDAGYVVMAPMLRGENGNPGSFELFFGEVDDGKAACQWLAKQEYVDSSKIFAFGHSVGGGVSAMLSLMDDVPIVHSGSSGGLYGVETFSQWSDIRPFGMNDPQETKLRVLVGNVTQMKRTHFAYIGSTDFPFHSNITLTGLEGGANSKLRSRKMPGDHFTSFGPSLREYLSVTQQTK